jgi:hypothetical protein
VNRNKQLKGLAYQSLAENDVSVLENFIEKDRKEKKRKRAQEKAARKRNRKK